MKQIVKRALFLIGQDLHILNPAFARVIEKRDRQGLIELAGAQISGGAMALDINLGPGRDMTDTLCWVIETIQEQWPIPLLLPVGEHLVSALGRHRGKATINAVTADPAPLADMMKLSRDHGANLVVLLTRPGRWHSLQHEQLQLALEVLELSDNIGLPLDNLYLDPVFSMRADPLTWNLSGGMPDLDRVVELLVLIGELTDGRANTLLALGNATMGLAPQKRSSCHCRMLPLLAGAGLNSVILDCKDARLMTIARGLSIVTGNRKKAA